MEYCHCGYSMNFGICIVIGEYAMDRFKLFVLWYKHLRSRRKEFEFSWYYHTSYNMWNCFRWAWENSGTHNIDGSYIKKKEKDT